MNKLKKIILSILGGIDITFYMFTPIMIAVIWIGLAQLEVWQIYTLFGVGLLATLFRAIKVGWLKND